VTARPGFRRPVIAVDWSGAKDLRAQRAGICVAVASSTGSRNPVVEASVGRTRQETIELLEQIPGPVVVGFDFSFSVPKWFADEHGCREVADVWRLAERAGETWLRPTPPFWRDRCGVPVERRFRRCELALAPAKSIFQLVGNGQVGAGSVRGMPLLARLRTSGFSIWPFDPPAERMALEIYPSHLRRLVPEHRGEESYASPHERDAVESARVMWEHRDSFATLRAATDPVTRIEGNVWTPS